MASTRADGLSLLHAAAVGGLPSGDDDSATTAMSPSPPQSPSQPSQAETGIINNTTYAPFMDPTSGAVVSSATFQLEDSAFSSWRESMSVSILHESRALQDHVQELQREFEDASQYIRGDYAWRKQVTAFHERTNDVVASAMDELACKLEQSTQSLAKSLDETLTTKDTLAKQEMDRQVRMYEDKLRRTRTSLKKEIDRFTRLEKCLRKEETHQAKSMYDRLVEQLTLEFKAKEATLHAMLREFKLSYVAIENANTQFQETVKTRDEEIERLKKLLPKYSANAAMPRASGSSRPGSGAASASAAAAAAAASDAHVQSLKQALVAANNTIDSLRKQVEESSSDKEQTLKKQRHAEETAAKVNDELTKVKHLLSESHGALVTNRKEMESLLQEKTHWKQLYGDLQFHSSSHEHARDDATRLAAAAQEQIESLTRQLQRKTTNGVSQLSKEMESEDAYDDHEKTIATKLQFELESKYSDMLNLRVSHERKRVLARIEMLWNKQRGDNAGDGSGVGTSAKKHLSGGGRRNPTATTLGGADGSSTITTNSSHKASLKQILQLVSTAFDDLGYTDWGSMDIDKLQGEIVMLKEKEELQQKEYGELRTLASSQNVSLAKADLDVRERELLLAELTERYRLLRAHVQAMKTNHHGESSDGGTGLDLSAWGKGDPFTVIGLPQPMEAKKRPAARSRPVSASATLIHPTSGSKPSRATGLGQVGEDSKPLSRGSSLLSGSRLLSSSGKPQQLRQSTPAPPKPCLLSQLPLVDAQSGGLDRTLQQYEDHVRSVLKVDLLSLTPVGNQLEDGGHVGADGILQIMQRRRQQQQQRQ